MKEKKTWKCFYQHFPFVGVNECFFIICHTGGHIETVPVSRAVYARGGHVPRKLLVSGRRTPQQTRSRDSVNATFFWLRSSRVDLTRPSWNWSHFSREDFLSMNRKYEFLLVVSPWPIKIPVGFLVKKSTCIPFHNTSSRISVIWFWEYNPACIEPNVKATCWKLEINLLFKGRKP